MKFSLVIPCFESHKTIEPLFNSLMKQGIEKEELQIIVVDDNSKDKTYLDIVKSFEDRFNIEYYQTNTTVHCPGNTREEGMRHATGDWLCFCDHDDQFEDNSFKQVKEYIESVKDHTIYTVATFTNSYRTDTGEYYHQHRYLQILMHGKWYSMKNLIIPFNIHFKKDLISQEDGYFNNYIISRLLGKNIGDWDYLPINTYKWCHNPNSVSRHLNNGRGFLYEHFRDYLYSFQPFFEYAKDRENPNIEFFKEQVLVALLRAYFYYEAACYFGGYENFKDLLVVIDQYVQVLIKELGYTKKFIVDYLYSNPKNYIEIYHDCSTPTGDFICRTSFRDFIYKLS